MAALLQLESVSRSFWRGSVEITVLSDVSLSVDSGDFVAVYGQRSAGKTTLLKVAAGFEPVDGGQVLFRGEDVSGMSRRVFSELHRDGIGWVEHAGPRSHDLSMRAYVAMPLLGQMSATAAQRLAEAALAEVGADGCATCPWAEISDADRMLVALAHALVRRPALLIVDDPTVGLALTDRELIVGLLRRLADDQGLGILMAVPDMPAMTQADRVHSLGRGRLFSPQRPEPHHGGRVLEFPGRRRES